MKLTFLGATRTVTGSKYLIEHRHLKVLIDCGLFQGYKALRLRNWEPFPVDPATINAIVLTHAHIDHSGYIPVLIKNGFKGKIYCTRATRDLCAILLPDSGHIQQEDSRRANKHRYTKHDPAEPLYTEKEGRRALRHFEAVDVGVKYALADDLHFTFSRTGHILGAACVTLQDQDRSILFSGDIGRLKDPILKSPAKMDGADYVVMESTYGDRLHGEEDPQAEIKQVVLDTIKRKGKLLIPSFAVGRAQMMLYFLYKLKAADEIPDIPIYLDSPMAINATNLLCKHKHDHHLSDFECKETGDVAIYTRTEEESKQLGALEGPAIIISASGMATGGRVLHHLKQILPQEQHTVLFVGFQAGGTRGDRLVRGAKELKLHGEMVPVRARIESIGSLSAHGDYLELLEWLRSFKKPPITTFLTHGESGSIQSFKEKIEAAYGWTVEVPEYLDTVQLD